MLARIGIKSSEDDKEAKPPKPKKISDKEQLALIRQHIEGLPAFFRDKGLQLDDIHFEKKPNSVEQATLDVLNRFWKMAIEKQELEESNEPFIERRVAEVHDRHEREIRARETRISDLETEIYLLKAKTNSHGKEIDRLNSEHWKKIEYHRKLAHEEQTRLKTENDSKLLAKDQHHQDLINELKRGFQAEKERYETQIQGERRRIKEEREEFETVKRGIKQEGEEEKKRLKSEQARQEKRLLERQAKMAKENEALNKSLLTRDRFKPITDLELKALFTDLEGDVTHLATLRWSSSQTEWPEDLLSKLSDNQRKLKKQLSQDLIWLILYERIFCTPFKVFGEEGRALGEKWNDAFGKDTQHSSMYYSWPKPAVDAERWRYQTMKGCKEAVEQSISDYDDRSKLKKEFNKNLESITQELIEALGKISQLDQNQMKSLEEIPKKAAKTWIEMGTQRCRILVILPGSSVNSQAGRLKKAREGGLDLVIVPELRRLGNSAGQDLDSDKTTICEVNTVKVLAE